MSVSGEYVLLTGQARKKLVGFGIAEKPKFKLRYSKVYMNENCYYYHHFNGNGTDIHGTNSPHRELLLANDMRGAVGTGLWLNVPTQTFEVFCLNETNFVQL